MPSIQKEPKFKTGGWVFHGFDLWQIREVQKDGRVTAILDGFGTRSGMELNDDIFPLDLEGKKLSDLWAESYATVREAAGNMNLNWPAIRGAYDQTWKGAMRRRHAKPANPQDTPKQMEQQLIEAIKAARALFVDGVGILLNQ